MSVVLLKCKYYKDDVYQGVVKLPIIRSNTFTDYYTNTAATCLAQHNIARGLMLGMQPYWDTSYASGPPYDIYLLNNVTPSYVDNDYTHVFKFYITNTKYFKIHFDSKSWSNSQHRYYVYVTYYNGSTQVGQVATTIFYDSFYSGAHYNSGSLFSIPWLNTSENEVTYLSSRLYGKYNGNNYTIATGSGYSRIQVQAAASFTAAQFKTWAQGAEILVPDPDNPYWDGGTSETSESEGNFSEESDDVTVDNLPSLDVIGTGMATIFKPSKAQLTALANVMWNSNFFTFMQNLVENISEMFTSLAIVPFEVTAGSTVSVTWLGFDTAVSLTLAAAQFYEFNMGSINLADDDRIFTSGSALDYSPFSKLGIFLPFIGFQDLDIDECRGSTLNLKYRIDILSGTCVALISINGNTIYQFTGNCLSQIPITNQSMQSLVSDAVNVGIAATASHAAGAAVGAAEAEWGAANTEADINKANTQINHARARQAIARGQLASATANASVGMKPTFGKAGSVSASASLLAVKQPYLFLTTPRQSLPEHYQKYCGFPSNITGKLSSFSGLTVVEDIRLNGLVATAPEVSEIYELLKSGVII